MTSWSKDCAPAMSIAGGAQAKAPTTNRLGWLSMSETYMNANKKFLDSLAPGDIIKEYGTNLRHIVVEVNANGFAAVGLGIKRFKERQLAYAFFHIPNIYVMDSLFSIEKRKE